MILLFVIAFLIPPSNADFLNKVRSHVADNLKLQCDSLPHLTAFVGTRCYFAIFRQVFYREASSQCSSAFKGARVALNDSGVFSAMMVDKSKFHADSDTSGGKNILCVYDSGYKCEEVQAMIRGKCLTRADKKMNFADAKKTCTRLGMDLPSIGNDLENRIVAGNIKKDPTWVQNTLVKRSNKLAWSSERGYTRYSTCDGASRKPQLYAGNQKLGCNAPMTSVIEKSGYWSNVGHQNEMDVICAKNARNEFTRTIVPKKVAPGEDACIANHELDESTGKCEWTGPTDACAELIDYFNNTWFMTMENYPTFLHQEVDFTTTMNPLNEHTVKVVVRRGCMFTGYSHSYHLHANQEIKVGENLVYGVHKILSYATGDFAHWDLGLTRAQCFCDPTEATVNGHIPSPPADQKCIDHHEFNETTQQCEWTKDPKFCAELRTTDNRAMLLEMPNWPTQKKYDANHHVGRESQHYTSFHILVNHIVVRQHCFATLYLNQLWQWKTLPTSGYGFHKVINWKDGQSAIGTARVVCECIK